VASLKSAAAAAAAAVVLMPIFATACSQSASSASVSPTPTPSPDVPAGRAYVVKQTKTLGGEVISGAVPCLTAPFAVTSVTPKVTFVFQFIPAAALKGAFTYAYSIPSAGETHSAIGSYTISEQKDGTLVLSMTGRDAVAFPHFNGPFPVNYSFNLVPSGPSACSAAA
jgi:hypothetical protein